VTEMYGKLDDLDSIDWLKISNVDVSLTDMSLVPRTPVSIGREPVL